MLAGTWLAIALTFVLLRACGFAPALALLGTAAMAASPMIRAYGTMVDTPVLAFPLAVAVVFVAVRADRREPLRWFELLVLAIAPLVAWQLVLLGILVVAGFAIDPHRRHQSVAALVATSAGCATTGGWLIWANGGVGAVVDQWLVRSSVDSDVGLRAALDTQWTAGVLLLGPLLLVLPFAVVAAGGTNRRRWLAVLSLASVAGYCLLLPNGAAFHDYWAYWVLLPVAVGTATLAELIGRASRARGYPLAIRVLGGGALLAAILGPGLLHRSVVEDTNVTSATVADVIASADLAPGQDRLWALAEFRLGDQWMDDLGVDIQHLSERRYERLVASGRHDDAVIVSTSCVVDWLACERIPYPVDRYRHRRFHLVTLRDLGAPPYDRP